MLQLTASEILDSNGDATIQADAYCLVKNFDKVSSHFLLIELNINNAIAKELGWGGYDV